MKVLFNCNASKAAGAGHLIRSISIAEQAKLSGLDVLFCGHFDTSFARSALSSRGLPVIEFQGDSEALAGLAGEVGVSLIHCDDYEPRPDLHTILAANNILLSNVEDGTHGSRMADLIIDPSPRAEELYRPGAQSTVHLRGLQYVPFRSNVVAAAGARMAHRSDPRSRADIPFQLLIVLGGTDAAGVTQLMARLWSAAVPDSICYAVVPGVTEEIVDRHGSCQIHWLPPSEDVTSMFSRVDAVITAAGTTIWELAAVGVPAAVIMQAKNQSANYNHVVDRRLMLGLGRVDDLAARKSSVQLTMKRLRFSGGPESRLEPIGVDLAGALRIVSSWTELSSGSHSLTLRCARLSDASNLFDWRNDEQVRAVSKDERPLEWGSHLAWLRSVLDDPRRILLVAQIGSALGGTVRFDQTANALNEWEISIALNPERRGQGLGSELLQKAENYLRSQLQSLPVITATVRADNQTSNHLFARNGYRQDVKNRSHEYFRWYKRLS